MNSSEVAKKFPFTEEELQCLKELSKMTDDDIDYSDIPPLTEEELKKFKPARLRRKKIKVAG